MNCLYLFIIIILIYLIYNNYLIESFTTKYNIDQFYTPQIQLHNKVILDIFNELTLKSSNKMLVFGLGYDSNMWYFCNNKNTYFIEHNPEYIELNKSIPDNNIIKYNYDNITIESSYNLSDEDLYKFTVPTNILNNGPYDIILIDGPEGWDKTKPGRLLPMFWSLKHLSKSGTIIYIDDSNRKLEKYGIDRYFKNNIVKYFPERNGTIKIKL